MRSTCITSILLALAACAQDALVPPNGAQVAAASASAVQPAEQICQREQPIGSNIPVTVCRPANGGRTVAQMLDEMPKSGAATVTVKQLGQN